LRSFSIRGLVLLSSNHQSGQECPRSDCRKDGNKTPRAVNSIHPLPVIVFSSIPDKNPHINENFMARFFDYLPEALEEGQPFALALISSIKGSSPQKQGAKALFFADGRIHGTLGGGCLEAEIQDRARRALRTQTPAQFELVLDHDFGWDDGLICGGKVSGLILPHAPESGEIWRTLARGETSLAWGVKKDFSIQWVDGGEPGDWLYQENVAPPCALWIAGSGHVAQAVAPFARQVDFEVTVFDDRPALANHRHFPPETHFRIGYWNELLRERLPSRPVFGLIVTRGHQHDALVLKEWIHQPFQFLGMIGSRRKARIIFDQFVAENLATLDQLANVACPVGLNIQAQSVPEIAMSIVAQFVQKRAEKMNPTVAAGRGAPVQALAETLSQP
jgi:xanthine dehydrogenase accessory factor